MYAPDARSTSATLIGSFGLFFTLFLLFCRFLPMIAIGEVKGVLAYAQTRDSSTRHIEGAA